MTLPGGCESLKLESLKQVTKEMPSFYFYHELIGKKVWGSVLPPYVFSEELFAWWSVLPCVVKV